MNILTYKLHQDGKSTLAFRHYKEAKDYTHSTMNELIAEKEQEMQGIKRKLDDLSSSSEAGSESEASEDEGEQDVVYRTVKCPHCKRWVWKVFKFTFKLTVLVIAQLISNYLLCNQFSP